MVSPEIEVWGWMRIGDKVPQALGRIDFLVAHVGRMAVSLFKRSRESESGAVCWEDGVLQQCDHGSDTPSPPVTRGTVE